MNDFKKKDSEKDSGARTLGFYRWLVIGVFVLAAIGTVIVDSVYLAIGEESVRVFVIDILIYLSFFLLIVVPCYFIIKRLFIRYQEGERKYRNLYESSIDGIVSVDMDGNILGANKAYLEMLGYSLEEARDLRYQQFTPEKWAEMERNLIDTQVTVRGYSDPYEKEYIRKDGSIFPISVRAWISEGERGEPVGMWALVRDITEQKAAEKELKRINTELEAFAHTVSHDLKVPLTAITLTSATLKKHVGKAGT
jgi:PAS domain S-box-containing protein